MQPSTVRDGAESALPASAASYQPTEYNAGGALATEKWLSGVTSDHAATSNSAGGGVAVAGVARGAPAGPAPTFSELVGAVTAQKLADIHGVHAPNAMQADAIPAALAGRDVVTIAQTGSGKTLSFLLPMLAKLSEAAATNHDPLDNGGDGGAAASNAPLITAVVIAPSSVLAEQHRAVAASLATPSQARRLWCTTPTGFLERVAADAAAAASGLGAGGNGDARNDVGSFLDQLAVVAVDEVDAVLCGTAYEEGLSTEGEALFATLQSVRGLQYLLAAAVLTAAHEKTLNAVFPRAVKVVSGVSGASVGVLVPTLRRVEKSRNPLLPRSCSRTLMDCVAPGRQLPKKGERTNPSATPRYQQPAARCFC